VTDTSGLHELELEPEVRDWLDSLSDTDYKRVDEVCGMLAGKGTSLGGPWSDHLNLTPAEVALRAGMTTDQIECIEEGGTEPTITLLRRLAAALDADVRITAGDDLGSVGFEAHAA
jgi:DNA-binding XRE family transcriptional regulator